MLKRVWGPESNGKLPHLFIPSKTATLVHEFAVEDLPLGRTAALALEFAVNVDHDNDIQNVVQIFNLYLNIIAQLMSYIRPGRGIRCDVAPIFEHFLIISMPTNQS